MICRQLKVASGVPTSRLFLPPAQSHAKLKTATSPFERSAAHKSEEQRALRMHSRLGGEIRSSFAARCLSIAVRLAVGFTSVPAGLSVIAVGGDKLSRGLTLEGLSVSYFLRASKMYDSLMQMGRWFGYRRFSLRSECRL